MVSRPDRSLGNADFYYDDDDELVLNVGNFYGLFIGSRDPDEILLTSKPNFYVSRIKQGWGSQHKKWAFRVARDTLPRVTRRGENFRDCEIVLRSPRTRSF